MTTRHPHATGSAVLAAAGLSLIAVTACSSGSASVAGLAGTPAASTPAASTPAATGQLSGKSFNDCTLVTARELSRTVGVTYTAIVTSVGSLCNVTGASQADSFSYTVNKEGGPLNTWSAEVAGIKRDDGSVSSVSGVGDRAAQGAIKEFAAEADGYIVFVINADLNAASSSSFTRTKKIARLLISKL